MIANAVAMTEKSWKLADIAMVKVRWRTSKLKKEVDLETKAIIVAWLVLMWMTA